MYTSGEIEKLSMSFESQMHRLENEVMADIVRRIKINSEITRAADWQINRLYELGKAKAEIEKTIKAALGINDDEMREMLSDAIESGYARNAEIYKKTGVEFIPFEENAFLQSYIVAVAAQTAQQMRNLSGSLGFAVKKADGTLSFKPIAEFYQDTIDNAINGIANGVFDYNTALKKAVSEMVHSGLRSVDYASGWSNRVDVAARRAVMTGVSQLTGKICEQNAKDLGTDTFEVTWHSGARPSHQVWQGRWYTAEELVSVCGLGSVTGLKGANCYHDYYPVIPGISEPTYTEQQLEEMNRKENTPVPYGGKQYTKYEALQRQRRLETTMRVQRQKIKLLKDGGASEDDIIAARARYRATSAEYTRFSKAMDLPQQRQRVTIDGLGNIGVGKWKKKLDIFDKSDIIESYKSNGLEIAKNDTVAPQTIHKIKESTARILSDFKDFESCCETVEFGNLEAAFGTCSFSSGTGKCVITLSESAFSNPESLLTALNEHYKKGMSYKVNGVESLVAHEMGHVAHIALALKRAKIPYGKPLNELEILLLRKEYEKISQEVYLTAFSNETYEEIQRLCVSQLGSMTNESPKELIAQSFGNYYYGADKSEIAKAIVKFFKKELK